MDNKHGKLTMMKRGLQTALPAVLGYIPVAITFGVLASQSGLTIFELTSMSVLVYAGASQFMGVNMILAQASAMEIIIATFVLNFRHFVMSLSFSNTVRKFLPLNKRLLLSLTLTDEIFAIASFKKEEAAKKNSHYFFLTLFIVTYLSWIFGSVIGGFLGAVIPERMSQSMGIALYAMFIGLLIPSVKSNIRLALISIIAMLINLIASQFVSSGWAIIIGTVFGGLSGVYLLKEKAQ